MPTQTQASEWVKLPSGLYVSNGRMRRNGELFTLHTASTMDIGAFNKEADSYGIHMDERDPPIDRLVKYSVFLSRRDRDGSFIPTNSQYVDMAFDTASAKVHGKEPLASLYPVLVSGPWDATRDILEFHGKASQGENKGKYLATLFRFNDQGELEPVDDIAIPPEGWIHALGIRHGLPAETGKGECAISNIENPSIQGKDRQGYHYLGSEPKEGEQRLALRGPGWRDVGLLDSSLNEGRSSSCECVAALRMRDATPEDYSAESQEVRASAREMRKELDSIRERLSRLAGNE